MIVSHSNPMLLHAPRSLGYFSFLFASRGYRVFAVEPLQSNRRAIEATLCLNPRFGANGRFTIIPRPVGPPAKCKMLSNYRNRGNGRLSCEVPGSKTAFRPCPSRRPPNAPLCENMSTAPLDSVLSIVPPDTPRPIVVKIDLVCGVAPAPATCHSWQLCGNA